MGLVAAAATGAGALLAVAGTAAACASFLWARYASNSASSSYTMYCSGALPLPAAAVPAPGAAVCAWECVSCGSASPAIHGASPRLRMMSKYGAKSARAGCVAAEVPTDGPPLPAPAPAPALAPAPAPCAAPSPQSATLSACAVGTELPTSSLIALARWMGSVRRELESVSSMMMWRDQTHVKSNLMIRRRYRRWQDLRVRNGNLIARTQAVSQLLVNIELCCSPLATQRETSHGTRHRQFSLSNSCCAPPPWPHTRLTRRTMLRYRLVRRPWLQPSPS